MTPEEDEEDEFYEEYGEEMIKSFLNFGIHFKEYVCEMSPDLCKEATEYSHTFAAEYQIKVEYKNDEFYYSSLSNDEIKDNFVHGLISLYMKFTDLVKEKDSNLWEKALQYATDYGGIGRVKFFHIKEDKDGDRKD